MNSIRYDPYTPIDEFYEAVLSDYKNQNQEEKQKHSATKTHDEPKKASKTNKKKNAPELDPFQLYVKTQLKLRKEEFKNTSVKNRNRAFAHEWNIMSNEEKQKIIEQSGHFRK
ncbi:hypothetical protein TRFO_42939 [Tritrichomonas foetus]|uniref:Uncharacterized protein n=1 Tax=Tritrichomonas foetus TaxID=1144522 RepID=A0A1J4KUP7_9EUKA|nr:hypothetical protein TRFO_42939 [Tritrichomonas foetus]|eukprot:OHT14616.1 hypothetical protein TRFO_42939 [Tritrichomonas foetus]